MNGGRGRFKEKVSSRKHVNHTDRGTNARINDRVGECTMRGSHSAPRPMRNLSCSVLHAQRYWYPTGAEIPSASSLRTVLRCIEQEPNTGSSKFTEVR